MSSLLNKVSGSLSNNVDTVFQQINTTYYDASKIQDNVQKFGASLTAKINSLSQNSYATYSETDIVITTTGNIIFPKYETQNILYNPSTGELTIPCDGKIGVSALLNVSSGSLVIQLWYNGVVAAGIASGSGPVSFNVVGNFAKGDKLSLYVSSGTGTISGYAGGLGCQFNLRW